jgi:hypothetical protein
MQHTGYSLIDENNNIIQSWYENLGFQSLPDNLILPNGDIVCAPSEDWQNDNYKLVKRYLVDNPPSVWHRSTSSEVVFDGTDVVETYVYPEVPNIVPQTVSPLQMRRALTELGLRTDVENAVETLDQDAKDAWQYATEIHRNNGIIANVATALNKTTEDIDNLFRLASTK